MLHYLVFPLCIYPPWDNSEYSQIYLSPAKLHAQKYFIVMSFRDQLSTMGRKKFLLFAIAENFSYSSSSPLTNIWFIKYLSGFCYVHCSNSSTVWLCLNLSRSSWYSPGNPDIFKHPSFQPTVRCLHVKFTKLIHLLPISFWILPHYKCTTGMAELRRDISIMMSGETDGKMLKI